MVRIVKGVTMFILVANGLFFVFSPSALGWLFVFADFIVGVLQLYGFKQTQITQPSEEADLLEEFAMSKTGREAGAPRMSQIPTKFWDKEIIIGPNGEIWWMFNVIAYYRGYVEPWLFETYTLDPEWQLHGRRGMLIDMLRIEIRGVPMRRTYEKLKLTAKESFEDLVTKMKQMGVSEKNASVLFQNNEESRSAKLQKIADENAAQKVAN
jgi:hypothetical protein